ncbi:MAG: hypothetical protein U5M50_15095 [Sphingobium sp.]|nr:hypothetical protein [Sphingobium sp.]
MRLRHLWQLDQPVAAYDIRVHAGRMAEMEVDLMMAPLADHEGWRVVALHTHSQAQKMAHLRTQGGNRSAMGAAAILAHEIKNPFVGHSRREHGCSTAQFRSAGKRADQ